MKKKERGGLLQNFPETISKRFPGYFGAVVHFIVVYFFVVVVAFVAAALSHISVFYVISLMGLIFNLYSIRSSWPYYQASSEAYQEKKEEKRLERLAEIMRGDTATGNSQKGEAKSRKRRKKNAAEESDDVESDDSDETHAADV